MCFLYNNINSILVMWFPLKMPDKMRIPLTLFLVLSSNETCYQYLILIIFKLPYYLFLDHFLHFFLSSKREVSEKIKFLSITECSLTFHFTMLRCTLNNYTGLQMAAGRGRERTIKVVGATESHFQSNCLPTIWI